jgi:hypothetical protein
VSDASLQAAVTLAWAQFKCDTKQSPEALDDYDAVLFQLAFTYGYHAALKRIQGAAMPNPLTHDQQTMKRIL